MSDDQPMAEHEAAVELLGLANQRNNTRELMKKVLAILKRWTGCSAVGIRFREGEDFPYLETNGFPGHFVELESRLCSRDDEGAILRDSQGKPILDCMCGNILQGRFDPAKPFFTPGGSFWSNGTTELLATTTEADRQARTRNRCNGEGYESVALIPLRAREETFGLMQVNDRKRGRFTPELIALLERLAGVVALMLWQRRTEEDLRRTNEELSAANEELAATEEELRNQVEEILAGREALRRKNEELAATEEELRTQLEEILTGREALGRQSKFLKTIIDSLTYPFYVINVSDYTIQLANKALGANLPEGMTCHALTHRSDKPCDDADNPCTIEKVKQSGQPVVLEHTHYDARGNARYVEIHASPILDSQGNIVQVIESAIDITDRRSMEEQLLQAQKMEAVGRLAGGVAHDFNNLLTAIMGYSELALDALPEEHPERNHIEEIRKAGERAAALTRQLLAFSRKQIFEPEVLCLNEVVSGMTKMLKRMIPEDVELISVLDPGLERVKLDPTQIEQVLMNLAVNARDAMPRGGKLTLETANVELDLAYTRSHPEVQPGKYVMLAVSDTGCGMDRETQAHIFEPFFTTKEKDKGTGLGLSTVYGIVKQSGGSIFVYSEPGKGTAFKIYLPRVEEVPGERGPVAEKRPVPALPQGAETVLVAEDDETLRRLIYEILQSSGYAVLEAGRGEEALRLAGEHAGPIHLLITDMVMPGMGGREVAGRLAALRPGVRVLYVSGYTDDAIVRHGVLEHGVAFLQKPFVPEALLRKVRETLDAPEGPGV